MLIKRADLEGIRSGDIRLAFRRWKRPTVKAGGTLKTAIGELAIDAVDRVTLKSITDAEARAAGCSDRADLLAELRRREGTVYRVALRYAGVDPRIALRNDAELSPDERAAIAAKLDGYDTRSKHGPWTADTMRSIAKREGVRAPDLAATLGFETAWFKANVRKLKALGLTESLEVGYRLSPRGRAFLGKRR